MNAMGLWRSLRPLHHTRQHSLSLSETSAKWERMDRDVHSHTLLLSFVPWVVTCESYNERHTPGAHEC
jgi:hypothetical protein